ncbi:Leucine-rich repeat-containing protein 74, partial [Globisporangium splendens]
MESEPVEKSQAAFGVEAPPSVELRAPAQANPFPQRKEWVSNGESVSPETSENSDANQGNQDHMDWAAQKLFTLDRLNQYRSPIANTGCGAAAVRLTSFFYAWWSSTRAHLYVLVGVNAVQGILRASSTLRVVRLSHCQITDAGAILLASGLRVGAFLHKLDLSNQTSAVVKNKHMDNEIGCSGSLAIALALGFNKSLTQLSRSGNPIGAQGGRALATVPQKNRTLKRLELERYAAQ